MKPNAENARLKEVQKHGFKLRCDERFTHAFTFLKKLPWLTQTKVITLKTQLHTVNAR